jgi:hypothetical protein
MTGVPTANKQWQITLFIDGKQVATGETKKFEAPNVIPPSIVLGAELFYLHDAYYRGLIGRVTVLDRAVTAEELKGIAAK